MKQSLATLSHNQDPIGMYFTKLKTLIDELDTYRPTCNCGTCTCDGLKELVVFLQMEYLTDFLMRLNENFSQARAQLLLMYSLPSTSRAFSILLQEEQQRSIGSFASSTLAMAFTVSSSSSKSNSTNKQRRDL